MSDAPAPTRAEEGRKYEYDPIENLRGKLDAAIAEVKRTTCERDAARTETAMYERRAQERLWRQHDAEARAVQAEAEVARLKARLEIDHAYDGAGNRIPFPEGMGDLDGIACRDETIKLVEAEVARLRERVATLEAALKPFAVLSFTYDGFSCEAARLIFGRAEHGPFTTRNHAAFEKMIAAARTALEAPHADN